MAEEFHVVPLRHRRCIAENLVVNERAVRGVVLQVHFPRAGPDGLQREVQPRLAPPDGRFRLLMFGAGAQRLDAVGQVVRQFREQFHLGGVEGVHLGGIQHQHPEHFPGVAQGQRHHGGETALRGLLAPGREGRVGLEIMADGDLAGADGGADGSTSALAGVRPGDLRFLQVALVTARAGDDAHSFILVILRVTHPRHPVAALFDNQPAEVLQQVGFGGGAHQHLVALADGFQRAVLDPEILLHLLAPRNQHRHQPKRGDADQPADQRNFPVHPRRRQVKPQQDQR